MRVAAVLAFSWVLVLSSSPPAYSLPLPAVTTSVTNSFTGFNTDQAIGWEFTANSFLSVTHLGLWDNLDDGLPGSYEMGLYRVSDQALLGSVTVGVADALDAHFRYAALASAVALSTGENYAVVVYTGSAPTLLYITNSPPDDQVTYDSTITYVAERKTNDAGSLIYPDELITSNLARVGPTFRFVPEPTTSTLFTVGLLLGFVQPAADRKCRPHFASTSDNGRSVN